MKPKNIIFPIVQNNFVSKTKKTGQFEYKISGFFSSKNSETHAREGLEKDNYSKVTVPGPAASGLAQDGGAASAHNHSLGVAEHCRDPDNNQQIINIRSKSYQP